MTTDRRSAPPEPLQDDALVAVFDESIVPKYWGPFARHLLAGVADRIPANARVLEVGCATGQLTLELEKRVPEGRVMAVESRTGLLDVARMRASELTGRRVFFTSDSIERVGFADATFDAVVANLPLEGAENPDDVLCSMRRLVAPGGTLALTLALAGTWSVVLDVYEEILERFDFEGAADRLAMVRARMPEAEEARARFEELGLTDVVCETWGLSLRFRNARELFRDPFVAAGPLETWKTVAGDDAEWERALFHMREAMDTYFAGADAIEAPVSGAVLVGRATG